MVKVLFDTNILIDYLNGIAEAERELLQYPDKAISLITWMEVMAGASDDDAPAIEAFLAQFEILPIEGNVAAEAVKLRQARNIKLPDAIILASARVSHRLLITRNTKDFPLGADAGIRVPYQLGLPPHRSP